MEIIRDGKKYTLTTEETNMAGSAILLNVNPHYEVIRECKKIELTKDECRSCLIEKTLRIMEGR